jgi:hypothetical protein
MLLTHKLTTLSITLVTFVAAVGCATDGGDDPGAEDMDATSGVESAPAENPVDGARLQEPVDDPGVDVDPLATYTGPRLDIDKIGLHFGADATPMQAWSNVVLLNKAAEKMRVVDGALVSTHGGIVVIGAQPGGESGHLVHSGNDSGTEHGLNRWYLANVMFKLGAHQPMFPEGTFDQPNNPASMIYLAHATAPELYFFLDGNAANQYQIDLNRQPGSHSHRAGFFGTGLDLYEVGPTKFGVAIYNIRSITGATGKTTLVQNGVQKDVPAGECFHMQTRRSTGGDTGWIHSETNDGSEPGSKQKSDTRASGPVWHFIRQSNGRGSSPTSRMLLTSNNVRHGVGTYCGGSLQILPGSWFLHCEHGINLEAGTPNNPDVFETFQVIVGAKGGNPVITEDSTAIGIQSNGNSQAGNRGIYAIDVYNWKSTNDFDPIEITGDAPGHYTVHDSTVLAPRGACAAFSRKNPQDAARFHVVNSAVQLDGTPLYSPTDSQIGSGTWRLIRPRTPAP